MGALALTALTRVLMDPMARLASSRQTVVDKKTEDLSYSVCLEIHSSPARPNIQLVVLDQLHEEPTDISFTKAL